MTEVLLFHHALGLTPGCLSFAARLRAAGHDVHTPDLYEGATFTELDEGVAHAQSIGFGELLQRGHDIAEELPPGVVYAGFSLGVMNAQALAQTRAGAKGALLMHGAAPADEFGPWPDGLPLQIHTMDGDDWGDVDVARDLAATIEGAELYLYAGDAHLFTDDSLPAYDPAAAALVEQRALAFLERIG